MEDYSSLKWTVARLDTVRCFEPGSLAPILMILERIAVMELALVNAGIVTSFNSPHSTLKIIAAPDVESIHLTALHGMASLVRLNGQSSHR